MVVIRDFWRKHVVLFVLLLLSGMLFADSTDTQSLYKQIADGLISIRKEYPASQLKVFSLLDQVEKLYTAAKNAEQYRANLKEQLRAKVAENVALKTELVSVKTEVSTVKKAIETTKNEVDQKLEEERLHVEELLSERQKLQSKLADVEGQKKVAENEEEDNKNGITGRKKDFVALASTQKMPQSDQPSLKRISTSEPSSPR